MSTMITNKDLSVQKLNRLIVQINDFAGCPSARWNFIDRSAKLCTAALRARKAVIDIMEAKEMEYDRVYRVPTRNKAEFFILFYRGPGNALFFRAFDHDDLCGRVCSLTGLKVSLIPESQRCSISGHLYQDHRLTREAIKQIHALGLSNYLNKRRRGRSNELQEQSFKKVRLPSPNEHEARSVNAMQSELRTASPNASPNLIVEENKKMKNALVQCEEERSRLMEANRQLRETLRQISKSMIDLVCVNERLCKEVTDSTEETF